MKIKIIKELFDLKIDDKKLKQLDVILDIYFALKDIKEREKELNVFPLEIDEQLDKLIIMIKKQMKVI